MAEDGLIGPFDFEKDQYVGKIIWDNLKDEAKLHDVDVSDLERVMPLGS